MVAGVKAYYLSGGLAHRDARCDWEVLLGTKQSNLRMTVDGRHPGLGKENSLHESVFWKQA